MSCILSSFSPCGEYFVTYNEAACLTIWETATNSVKKQFDVHAHLKTNCSSLNWGSFKHLITESFGDNKDYQLLIIGTEKGEIYLYNYNTGKIILNFGCGNLPLLDFPGDPLIRDVSHKLPLYFHSSAVNDLSMHLETERLYSCSSDKSVIIWNTYTGESVERMKARMELYSICVIDQNRILTGGSSILWWDTNNMSILKEIKCTGNPIKFLSHVVSSELSSTSYLLSAAYEDLQINAWSLNEKSRKCIASFTLSEELQNVDANKCFSKDNPLLITTVTKSGNLVLFQHVLNGKRTNLAPHTTLKIMAKPSVKDSQPTSIPVISSKILDCAESCIIAYGSIENPIFESVNIYDCPKTLTLTREIPLFQKTAEKPNNKHSTKESECAVINGRDSVEVSSPSSSKRRKQKKPKSDIQNDSQKDGVDLINSDSDINSRISCTSSPSVKKKLKLLNKKTPPIVPIDSESEIEEIVVDENPSELAKILIKGVEEKKKHLVNSVLKHSSDELIRKTVRNFPLHSLNSILQYFHRKLILEEKRYNSSLVKWLKETLDVHLSYLITCDDIREVVNNLRQYIDKRKPSEMLLKMNLLRGLLKVQLQNLSSDEGESDSEQPMES